MSNISEFRNEVRQDVHGVPNPVVDNAILATCIDFCSETGLWQEMLPAINVVQDQAEYTLTSANGQIEEVMFVHYDDVLIAPISRHRKDFEHSTWRTQSTDNPNQYFIGQDRILTLIPTPNAALANGLKVWVILKPLRTATTVPDFMFNDYLEVIGYGAKAKLLKMRQRPWYDRKDSTVYAGEYMLGRDKAKAKFFKGYAQPQEVPSQLVQLVPRKGRGFDYDTF
jgi:hypothetical protein